MVELKSEESRARPGSGRAFLNRHPLVLPGLEAHLLFWPLVVAGLLLDLWSKSTIFDWLPKQPGNSFSIIDGFLRLVMALNDGAAFGLFPADLIF